MRGVRRIPTKSALFAGLSKKRQRIVKERAMFLKKIRSEALGDDVHQGPFPARLACFLGMSLIYERERLKILLILF